MTQGIGIRYVLMIISMIGLVFALVPAALVAGIVGVGLFLATHTMPIFVPALVGAAAVLVECWLATELLGGRFERMDVSAIDPAA